ncbi:four-carbon acid sugar kinase family protein [Candidatus Bathyarchaeota archaeon]|nr:four-carbon acid sugar kinase family protein [Candidatus Bathyarchaeota archaeon]
MSRLIGVIADDFTGACDVGVQFKKIGLETMILRDVKIFGKLNTFFDVIVVNTETRKLDSKKAYDVIRCTIKDFRKHGIKLFYKKVDSTLRGNIGAELDAILDGQEFDCVVFAPSYPEQGRIVKNGQVFVKGVPLKETEFAKDLINPIGESDVQKIIRLQSNRKIGHINMSLISKGKAEFRNNLVELLKKGTEIVVADAETEKDLAIIADVSRNFNVLLCGSAGLAKATAPFLSHERKVLVVTGSVNTITLNQVIVAHEQLGIPILEPDLKEILKDDCKLTASANNLAERAITVLDEKGQLLMRLACSRQIVQKIVGDERALGLNQAQIVDKLLSILGFAVKEIIEIHKEIILVLIGGDTSNKVMQIIGAKGIKLDSEISPGIVAGRVIGGKYEGTSIVTKAGGFGDEQTLVKVIEHMRNPYNKRN